MIISASRRTDIPAFYGRWFMDKISRGQVIVRNPFNGVEENILLSPHSIDGIVFWSRNFAPMIENYKNLLDLGYSFYFQFTIIGYPAWLDPGSPPVAKAAKTAATLSRLFGPRSVVWRYDPVALTSKTDASWHIDNFKTLLKLMAGSTDTCVISFIDRYKKMDKKIFPLLKKRGVTFCDPSTKELGKLAEEMRGLAQNYGIAVTACCEPEIIAVTTIEKNACIDIKRLSDISVTDFSTTPKRPTRTGCGCWASKDIGAYDTCISGCAYCYATGSNEKGKENYAKIDAKNLSLYQRPGKAPANL